ncbi:hypothetical protein [Robiginitalea marina]|uniref:Lipoprotein n=1 Tax=Robiginitalea marina TaxID=2954105 RepID=A0ABT1B1I2_9FLAO|nr:hypothetical protein [Robiginitalea marina]MCO5725742.1 hypothetical protein [Robiginitalea marina]
MKNQLSRWGTCLALVLAFTACEKQETVPAEAAVEYFIAKDLSFLNEDLPELAAKGWPVDGCKEFTVKVKIPVFGESTIKLYHCCVNSACNLLELTNIVDFFLGDKSDRLPSEIEIISSEKTTFKRFEFRIRPGTYRLDPKTGSLEGMEYEVWAHRK